MRYEEDYEKGLKVVPRGGAHLTCTLRQKNVCHPPSQRGGSSGKLEPGVVFGESERWL